MAGKSVPEWLEEEIAATERQVAACLRSAEKNPNNYDRARIFGGAVYEEGYIDGLKVALAYHEDFDV